MRLPNLRAVCLFATGGIGLARIVGLYSSAEELKIEKEFNSESQEKRKCQGQRGGEESLTADEDEMGYALS